MPGGREPCRMQDIKSYKSKTQSVSFSQILQKDYSYEEARVVMTEMILHGCQELMDSKSLGQKYSCICLVKENRTVLFGRQKKEERKWKLLSD